MKRISILFVSLAFSTSLLISGCKKEEKVDIDKIKLQAKKEAEEAAKKKAEEEKKKAEAASKKAEQEKQLKTLTDGIENYANVVLANYEDALNDAKALKLAVDKLVSTPSQSTLDAAKKAWLNSRETYGQTEAFRFYDGPIDNSKTGPEGQLNAWPLDEAHIDYVKTGTGGAQTNIINNTTKFPTITKAIIAANNEKPGETNVSSGYHAVEFLLWGQDLSDGPGAGTRPYTDYVVGKGGTNANQARRGTYLKEATQLIIDDLQGLVNQWKKGGTYRTNFTAPGFANLAKSLTGILTSLGKLSKGELAGERMATAWDAKSKEDEHSCFSDNTHRDIVNNAIGMENVYLGRYTKSDGTTVSGTSIYDVVKIRASKEADELKDLIRASVIAAQRIQPPFDQEFLSEPGRTRIKKTIDLLRKQGDKVAEVARKIGAGEIKPGEV